MRLVLAALSRPLPVVVALVAIAYGAMLAIERILADIFPQIGGPAIYVAQPYAGMDPAQMEGYFTYYYEYHFLYITGHRSRRKQEHPGHLTHETGVSRRHRHEPGNVGDGWVCKPGPLLHAAGHCRALHHALRRRQCGRR